MQSEIVRDINGPNTYGYLSISDELFAQWSYGIDVLLNGSDAIPPEETNLIQQRSWGALMIDCEYAGSGGVCDAKAPGLNAHTGQDPDNPFRDINLCLSNMQVQAAVKGTTMTTHAIGSLAHEVTHRFDDSSPHPSGKTEYAPCDTEATTLGLAAEHVALSGELRMEPNGMNVAYNGSSIELTVDGVLLNDNPLSVVDGLSTPGTAGIDAWDRNPATNSCLVINGERMASLDACDPFGASQTSYPADACTPAMGTGIGVPLDSLTATVPLYTPGQPTLSVEFRADCDAWIPELDEEDNSAWFTISTEIDLGMEVEIASAPVLNTSGMGGNSWYTLTYEVEVMNLDHERTSPPMDVHLLTQISGTTGTRPHDIQWTQALAPGASEVLYFSVDVATDPLGSGPTEEVITEWRLDWDAVTVHDPNLDNNYKQIVINDAYWKPDYRARVSGGYVVDSLATLGLSSPVIGAAPAGYGSSLLTMQFDAVVENFGPVATEQWSTMAFTTLMGTPLGSARIGGLGVRESSSAQQFHADYLVCGKSKYTLTADFYDDIFENEWNGLDDGALDGESNNSAEITVGHTCPDLSDPWLPSEIEIPIYLEIMPWYRYDIDARYQIEDLVRWYRDFVDWVLATQSNGPFLPDYWVEDFYHRVTVLADHQYMITSSQGFPSAHVDAYDAEVPVHETAILTGWELTNQAAAGFDESVINQNNAEFFP